VAEDRDSVRLNVELPRGLHGEFKVRVWRAGSTLADVIRAFVEGYVETPGLMPDQVRQAMVGVGQREEGPG
jgi:hypothetical protein